jgi:Domain of unknown function (DUF4287)/Domain of unknown function (DUF5655)
MSEKSESDKKMFQSYMDNIKAKTGKTPDDFRALATKKGLVKNGEIVSWLKTEFGLGHGHASAIAHLIVHHGDDMVSTDDQIAVHFAGNKAEWRKTYDGLMSKIARFGADIEVEPTKTYLSLLRGRRKFAILQTTADRLDIGIKLKGVAPAGRLEAAGSWNAMVTHRLRISNPKQIDKELLAWLKQAYDAT